MGYRSKVIIGVKSGELSKEFEDILRKHKFPVDKPDGAYFKIHRDHKNLSKKESLATKTFYTFEYTKWYESDDWCKEIVDWLISGEMDKIDRQDGVDDVFCIGLGEDGQVHSEIGDYHDYVERVCDINLID